MKHLIILIYLSLLFTKTEGQTRLKQDTSNLKQDQYFYYFCIPLDTSIVYKDYKYQYKFKRTNRRSINKKFTFNGCKARIVANIDSIDITLINDFGPKHFKFILWLKDSIYIVYIDSWTVTKVCRVNKNQTKVT